jgi:ribosome-binding factor A
VDKGKPPTDLEILQNPELAVDPTEFQTVILDLAESEKTHMRYEMLREEKLERKYKKIREKIQEKREIRDKYKEFKLDLHKEDAIDRPPDAVQMSTQSNAQTILSEILNSPKMGIQVGILQGCFISVLRVQSNAAMSVLTVFYTVIKPEIERKPGFSEEKKQLRESVRRKLIHSKGFIASQLVRQMGLKFAPELRFIPYVVGAPAKQVVDPEVLKEVEGNSELIWQLAEMEDQKLMTPRMPGKYVGKRVRDMKAKPKVQKDS